MTQHKPWSIARFPQEGTLLFTVLLWVAFFALIMVVTGAIAIFGEIRNSVWEQATQLPRWFAFGTGIWLTGVYLRVYVAHGQTRSDFMRRASVFVVAFAAVLAGLTTLGFLLELALYRMAGWSQTFSREYLFDSAGQIGPILLTFLLVYLVWTVMGALLAAAFRRLYWYGLLVAGPLAIVLVITTEAAVGSRYFPLLALVDVEVASSVPLALAVGTGGAAICLAATWALVREMPLCGETA
jgi:hypothetical protein